jgi:hypothetical protein
MGTSRHTDALNVVVPADYVPENFQISTLLANGLGFQNGVDFNGGMNLFAPGLQLDTFHLVRVENASDELLRIVGVFDYLDCLVKCLSQLGNVLAVLSHGLSYAAIVDHEDDFVFHFHAILDTGMGDSLEEADVKQCLIVQSDF